MSRGLNIKDRPSPLVCMCATAVAEYPDRSDPWWGQCVTCWRPIVSLHPGLISALRHWPDLAHQLVILPMERVE